MSDKLLTDAELAAIAKRKEIAVCGGYLMRQSCEDISRLLADLHRYRAWCRRLVEIADDQGVYIGMAKDLAREVRAALEGK